MSQRNCPIAPFVAATNAKCPLGQFESQDTAGGRELVPWNLLAKGEQHFITEEALNLIILAEQRGTKVSILVQAPAKNQPTIVVPSAATPEPGIGGHGLRTVAAAVGSGFCLALVFGAGFPEGGV